jgi:tetracycline repressor-like protein
VSLSIKTERYSFFNTASYSFYKSLMAQVKKAEIRERILAAAAALFTEHGYARATIKQIAKAAGIAPSNVWRSQGISETPRLVLAGRRVTFRFTGDFPALVAYLWRRFPAASMQ